MNTRIEDRELRALYEENRASLTGMAYRIRYAVVETALVDPGEPSAAEIDRYYRAHLADYSFYDASNSRVVERSLPEVKGDVRLRWRHERRMQLADELSSKLEQTWRSGRRDAALERRLRVREVGPVLAGTPADTGAAGAAIGDSLRQIGGPRISRGAYARGRVVFHVFAEVPDFAPSYEQVRPRLAAEMNKRREQEDEQGARAWFATHGNEFRTGKRIFFNEMIVPLPQLVDVPLTRAEVESYHLKHLDRFSAAEETRVRHILISPAGPGPEADAAARKKAEGLLERIRAGEDFAELAKKNSDDDATRPDGGDLGFFRHGSMLDAFEEAAFQLRPGDVSDVVKSEIGYHIIKCIEYAAPFAEPLSMVYPNVGEELARERAKSIGFARADSLRRTLRTPVQARALAQKIGYPILELETEVNDPRGGEVFKRYFNALSKLKPEQFHSEPFFREGNGWAITWLVSQGDPTIPEWSRVRGQVVQRYQQSRGRERARVKSAELDSLMGAGWSLDSLAALWGGLQRAEIRPTGGLQGLGGAPTVDSLVFGTMTSRPVVEVGRVGPWFDTPIAITRLRLVDRHVPDDSDLAARVQRERRRLVDRRFNTYFASLKSRFAITILDSELREVPLPDELQSAGS